MKILVRLIILLVILGAIALVVGYMYLNHLSSPVDPNGGMKSFVVRRGENATQVAEKLQKEGLIRSSMAFRWELRKNPSANIEAGDYKLSSAMSTAEVIKNLQNGSLDKWITLLEGWRAEQVADALNKELGVNSQEFLKHAKEGYMFPDTYLFNPRATPQSIAQTLENTFNQRYSEDLKGKIRAKGLTPEQGIILASIVEREARSDQVRTEVAGILLKRFKMGMAINADATVQYAKDTQKLKSGAKDLKFWGDVTREDYRNVNSPYNTYLHSGFPPAPICNPSLSSLKAVANANPQTPYTYYYHDAQGNSYYAKTLEEHEANVSAHPY